MEKRPISPSIEQGIINPEIPDSPEGKYELLHTCIAALKRGLEVQGVTPRHIGGTEGIRMLDRARMETNPSRIQSGL